MKDRIFTTKNKAGEDWKLRFKRPTQAILTKADLASKKAFSNNLRDGLLLNKEAEDLLRARGLWDDEKDKKAQDMRAKIASLEEELKSTSDEKKGKPLCEELLKLRQELISHNGIITSVVENTCEAVANNERNYYLAAACVYDEETGEKVYKDIEDFKNRLDELASVDCYRETLVSGLEALMGRDLPSDLSDEYPEVKWLREHKEEDGAEEAVKDDKPKTKVKSKSRNKKTSKKKPTS